MAVLLVILVILIILSFIFSGTETALFSIKEHQLSQLKDKNKHLYKRIKYLLNNSSKTLLIILLSNTLVNLAATSLSLKFFEGLKIPQYELYNLIIMSIIIILIGEIFPKTIALKQNINFISFSNYILTYMAYLLYPFIFIIEKIDNFIMSKLLKKYKPDEDILTRDELFGLLYKNREFEDISKSERLLYENFMRLLAYDIRSIMVHRSDIHGINIESDEKEIKDFIRKDEKDYIILYSGNINNLLGIVYIEDLIDVRKENLINSLKELVKKVNFIPETANLNVVLNILMDERIVFIVNEYGDLEGMIDNRNLMEKFFVMSSDFIKKIGFNKYKIMPNTTIYEIELFFERDLFKEKENTTLLEYFLEHFNRVPRENDYIDIEQAKIIVNEMEEFRIKSFVLELINDND